MSSTFSLKNPEGWLASFHMFLWILKPFFIYSRSMNQKVEELLS